MTSETTSVPATAKNGRNTLFTILKAIAILCVVLSHAGVRGWLFNFLFTFHVPVFFLCAGYFFHTKYLNDERTFLVHRVRGLYFPFLRWSLFFLVFHNLMFSLGILSEKFGNAGGGVLHPYSWHDFGQNLWNIVFNMSGYDQFLCGTFWFFRALFLASIGFLILFKLFRRSGRVQTDVQAGWGILAVALVLAFWKTADNLRIAGVAQGGYRELMGVAFMAMGFLLRQYRVVERLTWKIVAPCALFWLLGATFFPSCMKWNAGVADFFKLPLVALCAFVTLTYLCGFIDRKESVAKRVLVYIGDRTLYIFAFHLVAFKLVSAIKVAAYGLPWESVGSYPTVFNPQSNVLWILLYLVVGAGLPLLWLAGYRRIASKVTFTEKQVLDGAMLFVRRVCVVLSKAARSLGRFVVKSCRNLWQGIKDLIAASSIKEE